ncbi:MAG TPA: hypothetical protein VGJ16_10010 [Pirellulales bacterium]|jgi:non-heme chloroperoxidase
MRNAYRVAQVTAASKLEIVERELMPPPAGTVRLRVQAGFKNVYECIKAFSETDQTEDLKKFDVPTLIIQGDDDQIVPIGAASMLSSKIVRGAILKVYAGAPHGLTTTHQDQDQVNADLLAFCEQAK